MILSLRGHRVAFLLLGLVAQTRGGGHLQFFSAYDIPASQCANVSSWVNVRQGDSADDATLCAQYGVRTLWSVEKLLFNSTVLGRKGCASVPGGCILADWKQAWRKLLPVVTPLVENKTILGFNLGDELICHTLSYRNLSVVADAIRASFPEAIIWWNECGHTVAEPKNPNWEGQTKIPESVNWMSIDFPYETTTPAGAKAPHWNHSDVTLAPASMQRAFLEQWVYPKLHDHQAVMLLVPAFGSRCGSIAKAPMPPSVCTSLECNDANAARLVGGFMQWAREDPRVACVSPTFFTGCGRKCFPSICNAPPPAEPIFWDWMDVGFGEPGAMPNTLRGWQEAGRTVVQPH